MINSKPKYIKSELDGHTYCVINGRFARHLRLHGYTYRQYYEKFINTVGDTTCKYCQNPKQFYVVGNKYAKTCGDPKCVGLVLKETKHNWTQEQKDADSANKKAANARRTDEDKQRIAEKIKTTTMKHCGCMCSFQSDETKAKAKATKKLLYNDENYSNRKQFMKTMANKTKSEMNEIKLKRETTNLERYGTENVLLCPGRISKSNKGNAKIKQYIMPSGKIVGIMGYENVVLDILLRTFTEDDIKLHNKLDGTYAAKIEYKNVNNHKQNYYPDFYIKSIDTLIEVKSEWWWNGNNGIKYKSRLENNIRKLKATIECGYKYEVWIFNNKYDYRVVCSEEDI